jgi:hypothetical protein
MAKKSRKVRVRGNRKSRKNTRSQRGGLGGLPSSAPPRSQRGGALGGNPPSAWGWGSGTVGNGWTQFTNALTLQPGQNAGTVQSNNLVPVNNINAQDAQGMIGTNLKGDVPSQSGGKKYKKYKKHGGAWEGVISQAAAPAVLLAFNQFAKKNRSRRSHGSRRRL